MNLKLHFELRLLLMPTRANCWKWALISRCHAIQMSLRNYTENVHVHQTICALFFIPRAENGRKDMEHRVQLSLNRAPTPCCLISGGLNTGFFSTFGQRRLCSTSDHIIIWAKTSNIQYKHRVYFWLRRFPVQIYEAHFELSCQSCLKM